MFEKYFVYAIDQPWLFICLVMGFTSWKCFRWLSIRLFDDDKGLVTNYVKDLKKYQKEANERIAKAYEFIHEASDSIGQAEKNILNKMDSHKEEIIKQIQEKNNG